MYIIKNAFRFIRRSMGRSVLIGIICLVIAVSACIGLSIRQAAQSAKQSTLESMRITASISYDRGSMMQQIGGKTGQGGFGGFGGLDKNQFAGMMGDAFSRTLEEYEVYAGAASVHDFYYTLSAYFG